MRRVDTAAMIAAAALAAACAAPRPPAAAPQASVPRLRLLADPLPTHTVGPRLWAEDGRIAIALDAVIVRNGEGSWVLSAPWDEYLLTARNVTPLPATITGIALVDASGTPIAPQATRHELVAATRDSEVRSGRITWGGTASTPSVAVVPPAMLLLPMAIAVAVDVVNAQKEEARVEQEIERRHTPMPVVVQGQTALDLFYAIAPRPRALAVTYTDAGGVHTFEIDLREALARAHVEAAPEPVFVEPLEFPWDLAPADERHAKIAVVLTIDADGRVTRARVQSASPEIDASTLLRSLMHWRYTPAPGVRTVEFEREFDRP